MTKANNGFGALLDSIQGIDNVLKEVTATPPLEQPSARRELESRRYQTLLKKRC